MASRHGYPKNTGVPVLLVRDDKILFDGIPHTRLSLTFPDSTVLAFGDGASVCWGIVEYLFKRHWASNSFYHCLWVEDFNVFPKALEG